MLTSTWGAGKEPPEYFHQGRVEPEPLSSNPKLMLSWQLHGALAPQPRCWACEHPVGGRALAVRGGWAVGSGNVCFGQRTSPSEGPFFLPSFPASSGCAHISWA